MKLAEAYGAKGMRIEKKEDVEKALKRGLRVQGPGNDGFQGMQGRERLPDGADRRSASNMIDGGLA